MEIGKNHTSFETSTECVYFGPFNFFKRALLILCMFFLSIGGGKNTFVVAWQMAATKDIILDMFETDHMNLNFIHRCFTTSRVLQRNVSRENKVFEFVHEQAYIYIHICINMYVMMH